ncbi:MAG: universal stress protein [Methyloligellaceae bacterium]
MTESFLVGIDDSDCGERALDFACQRAKSSGSKLVLAYVIEWSPYTFNTPEENELRHKRREEEIERANSHVLEPAFKRVKTMGLDGETVVRHGSVAEVLKGLANEYNSDQVIVGRVGKSNIKSMLFGSVTSKLVQMSDVPVTVVP